MKYKPREQRDDHHKQRGREYHCDQQQQDHQYHPKVGKLLDNTQNEIQTPAAGRGGGAAQEAAAGGP